MYPHLIGLSGKMGSGKTTFANQLIDKSSVDYIKFSFADLLKQEAAETFGFPLEWCYTEEGKSTIVNPAITLSDKLVYKVWKLISTKLQLPRLNMTVREILQWYGTDYARYTIDMLYWIKTMDESIKKLGEDSYVIIDDVRFPDELEYVNNHNGLKIRLQPHDKWIPGKYANHISETALDNSLSQFDLVITPKFGELDKYSDKLITICTDSKELDYNYISFLMNS